MKLIQEIDGEIVYNPEIKLIKVFKDIIERDRGRKSYGNNFEKGDVDGRKKKRALMELAFIHFYCTHDSRFKMFPAKLGNNIRHDKIKEHLELPKNWKADDLVKQGCKEYKFLIETPSSKLVEASEQLVDKLRKRINNIDLEKTDDKGKYLHSMRDVTNYFKDLDSAIEQLNKAKERVEKELENKNEITKIRDFSLIETMNNEKVLGQI